MSAVRAAVVTQSRTHQHVVSRRQGAEHIEFLKDEHGDVDGSDGCGH